MSGARWETIDRLFNEALDLPPDKRRDFLARACPHDDDLRREVEAMLAADGSASSVLDRSRDELDALVDPSSDEPGGGSDLEAGAIVGPYRVIRRIGRGGMGAVYLAERADGQFRQQVALKLVRGGLDGEHVMRRFRSERQILADLQHPNIARLYDGGVAADGRPYIAMEFVDGKPIDRYCEDNVLSLEQRLDLFADVCDAVQFAHGHLVVHRDLKPSNILVTEEGRVKLLDFGIAKLLDDDAGASAAPGEQTQTVVRVLTPEYASPEQIRGEKTTTATDTYLLGLVLYELMTGRRAHAGTRHTGSPIEAALTSDVRAPSAVAPDGFRKRLRGDLDTIALKALRKEPERRYQSAAGLADDLRRFRANQPVLARPDSAAYRARKFIRRHRAGVGVATASVLLLVAVAVTTLLQNRRVVAERRVSEEVSLFLEDLLAGADPFSAEPVRADTMRIRDFLARGVERVEVQHAGNAELRSRLLYVLGRVHYKIGAYDDGERLLLEALAAQHALHGEADVRNAEIAQTLAGLYEETGRYDEAERHYRDALSTLRSEYGARDPRVAQAMSQLGYVYRLLGDLDRAGPLIAEALDITRARVTEPDIAFANGLTRYGILLQEKGDLKVAEAVHREALDIRRGLFPDGHPRLATTIANLAVVLTQLERYDEAEPLARESLGIAQSASGEDGHIKTAHALAVLGQVLAGQGRLDSARVVLRESIDMYVGLFGNDNRLTVRARLAMARVLFGLGDTERAAAELDAAIAAIRVLHGDAADEHPLMNEARGVAAIVGR